MSWYVQSIVDVLNWWVVNLALSLLFYYSVAFHSPPLRAYLLDGKFFLAAALASTLTKLSVRYVQQVEQAQSKNVSTLPYTPR